MQQLSAAVRADFHDSSKNDHFSATKTSSGAKSWSGESSVSEDLQYCQDGATSKVISVILGCATKTHSDMEIRSSCLEDVDFPRGELFF